jgi:hypothetical protein
MFIRPVYVVLLGAILGTSYGYTSAIANQNPHYRVGGTLVAGSTQVQAWHWIPSRLWLPSYLLCTIPRNGYGIAYTRSGYLFRSSEDRRNYIMASSQMGAGLGALGALCGLVMRMFVRQSG